MAAICLNLNVLINYGIILRQVHPMIPSLTGTESRIFCENYCKISNIGHTQNQTLNDSRLIMQLPLPNPLKPGVKSRMKM